MVAFQWRADLEGQEFLHYQVAEIFPEWEGQRLLAYLMLEKIKTNMKEVTSR